MNIGLEVWQIVLIGVGAGVISFVVSCVLAKFVCKLGEPKHKPWVENSKNYSSKDHESASNRDMIKSSDYDTYRDQF